MVLTKNYEELRSGSLMNTLVHLQKVCNHPYLMPAGAAIAPRLSLPESDRSSGHLPPFKPDILINVSGKLELMMRLLEGLKAGGHRVLIFSKMTSLLDLLEEALIFAKPISLG
ncbi:unnamed protein product [Protopolystoma xenopodis]|uniref:SNF2 N-terminal domain-containing protein n=1 Tax=Protopolystoma xenopodis TaxID=117903 RepID=A0A448WR02_9PLAT|nr:unnamed protein product [Protopolystoma xenopodis]